MSFAWQQYLQALGLADLENLAQSCYYRIRCATWVKFDLEYTGGLAKYQQPGLRLLTFTSLEEARVFLETVKQELKVLYGLVEEENK